LKRDELLIAALLGGVATIAGEIVTKILVMLNIGTYAVYELNSLILTNNRPSMLIGFLVNFIIGGHVAVLFYLIFKKLGTAHIVIKSTFCGMLLWLAFETAFTALIEDKYIPMRPITDHYVHALGTAAFGLTLGISLRIFLFKRKNREEKVG
jgi:hypothetical protein